MLRRILCEFGMDDISPSSRNLEDRGTSPSRQVGRALAHIGDSLDQQQATHNSRRSLNPCTVVLLIPYQTVSLHPQETEISLFIFIMCFNAHLR